MGRGSSGLGKKSGGGAPAKANTPSGIDYNQFMAMSDDQKYQTLDNIIGDQSIQVPSYLDQSATSKVMYALGMNGKPQVVSDDQLDKMPGTEVFRTVYDTPSPPPYAQDIIDQIRTGDYTQMSGSGGSVHGRALYFAEDNFYGSAIYGMFRSNAQVMRAKVSPNAKIVDEDTLDRQMRTDRSWHSSSMGTSDEIALYAIAKGYDGWRDSLSGYTMLVNRGCMVASSKNKKITESRSRKSSKTASRFDIARSWNDAKDV